jgi:hypothetical protein
MVKRLMVGMVVGLVVGVAAAAALSQGLRIVAFTGSLGALVAYAASAVTGAVTGLVAGKPIWAGNAKTEAGLKAAFGALFAAAAMFALRQWALGWTLDLPALHAGGPAPVAQLPAASLPLIGAVLGGFFGIDNSGDEASAPGGKRVAAVAPPSRARAATRADGGGDEEADAAASSSDSRRAPR